MKRQRLHAVATLVSAAASLAPLASSAHATYETLASGQTKLVLEQSFVSALKREGVTLSAKAPAKLKGSTVSFQVIGGKLDPTTERGVVDHEGALVFRAGDKSIPLKALQLKTTQKRSPLMAKVGGSQLKLATAKELEAQRAGFGGQISVSELTLSSKLATRLAKKLDRRNLFKAGMPLGRTITKANPEAIALDTKNKVELSLAPSFQAKLDSLFVAVNPVFPAEHPGPFTLPIFGGTIAPNAFLGTIETLGALELLQLGAAQLRWHDGWIDLQVKTFAPEAELLPSPPYPGKQDRASIASLALASSTSNPKARTVTVSRASLFLADATAASLNELFAKPLGKGDVFLAGEALASFAFVAQGQ